MKNKKRRADVWNVDKPLFTQLIPSLNHLTFVRFLLCTHFQVIFKGTKSYYPDFTDSRTVKTKALSKEFTNLYPGTKYDFVVFATTHCGNGDNSSMVTTHTLIAGMLFFCFVFFFLISFVHAVSIHTASPRTIG